MMRKKPEDMTDRELMAIVARNPDAEYVSACKDEIVKRIDRDWAVPDDQFPQTPKPLVDLLRKKVNHEFHLLRRCGSGGLREVICDLAIENIEPTDKEGVIDYTLSFTYRGTTCIKPYYGEKSTQPPAVADSAANQ